MCQPKKKKKNERTNKKIGKHKYLNNFKCATPFFPKRNPLKSSCVVY